MGGARVGQWNGLPEAPPSPPSRRCGTLPSTGCPSVPSTGCPSLTSVAWRGGQVGGEGSMEGLDGGARWRHGEDTRRGHATDTRRGFVCRTRVLLCALTLASVPLRTLDLRKLKNHMTTDSCVPAMTTDSCVPALTTDSCVPALTTDSCVPALTTDSCVPAMTTDLCVSALHLECPRHTTHSSDALE
jgi:hypothetical protein